MAEAVEPAYPLAPSLPLPQTPFYSVEYPGYVSTAPEAFDGALKTLGGQSGVDRVFKKPKTRILDLNLRPDDLFAHPIPGEAVNSNKILLKITTRKRRKKSSVLHLLPGMVNSSASVANQTSPSIIGHNGADVPPNPHAEHTMPKPINSNSWEETTFVAEAIGTITKTVRFRAMADFQYAPDPLDPVVELRETLQRLDKSTLETVIKYRFPEEMEEYDLPPMTSVAENAPSKPQNKSNLRLPPFPLFSRTTIPAQYNYKANSFSVMQAIQDPVTGEEKQRMINKTRFKGFGALSIDFHDNSPAPAGITDYMAASESSVNKDLLKRVRDLFTTRPIWAKNALLGQFTPTERREIHHSKLIIPLASYAFNDGPFRDTYIRFGYDPRKDRDARLYQRVTFRYTNPGSEGRRRPVAQGARANDGLRQQQLLDQPYIFDGKTMYQEVGPGFQLCDIHDPLLEKLINDTTDLRTECDASDGWYSTAAFTCIKQVTRRKLFGLIDEGRVISDSECADILEKKEAEGRPQSEKKKKQMMRAGPTEAKKARKRNKAKGAAPAEEAAARLKRAVRRQREEGLEEGSDGSEDEDEDEDEEDEDEEMRSDSDSDYRGR